MRQTVKDLRPPRVKARGLRKRSGLGASSVNIFLQDTEGSLRPAEASGTITNIFIDALANAPDSVRIRIASRQQTQFERFFLDRMESMTVASADEFFRQLVEQINEGLSTPFRTNVITHVSRFITINASFVAPLVRSGFLAILDLAHESMLDPNLRILTACVG
jgi:hypothetical protein